MSIIRWLLNCLPHDTIYREEGVKYLTRYYLLGGPRDDENPRRFNLYLHCFHNSDEAVPHNHPWEWAYSLILRGECLEFRPATGDCWMELPRVRELRPGMRNKILANDFHWVELITDEVWTLFLAGPHKQDWGWQTKNGFVPHDKYGKGARIRNG